MNTIECIQSKHVLPGYDNARVVTTVVTATRTLHVQHDLLRLDGVRVDLAHVFAGVRGSHVPDVQVPVLLIGTLHGEALVLVDPLLVLGQHKACMVRPDHLAKHNQLKYKAYYTTTTYLL